MKLQLNDEKTRVDPWSHIDTFEGWTVMTIDHCVSKHQGTVDKANFFLD